MYQRSSPEGCNSSDVDDTRSTTPRKTRPSSCQRAAAGATRPLAALLPIPTPMMMGGVGLGSIRSSMRGAFSCPPSHNGHGHQQPIRPFIPVHVHAQSCDTAASRAPVVNSTPPVPHVVRGRLRVDGGEVSVDMCVRMWCISDHICVCAYQLCQSPAVVQVGLRVPTPRLAGWHSWCSCECLAWLQEFVSAGPLFLSSARNLFLYQGGVTA